MITKTQETKSKTQMSDIEINLPDSAKRLSGALTTLVVQAPHLIALLLVVGGFLWHLETLARRRELEADRAQITNQLRIDTCHDVQERSIDASNELSKTLEEQCEAFYEMARSMDKLSDSIRSKM